MPTDHKQNTPNHDEIDLLTLFTKFGEFIKKAILGLIDFIGAVLVFLLRKWYYFVIAAILSIVTALIMNNTVEPYYYTDLVMRSNATHNQSIMSSLNKLGAYASEGNISNLSSELDLSMEEASAIRGLETFWYYDIGDDGIYDGQSQWPDLSFQSNSKSWRSCYFCRGDCIICSIYRNNHCTRVKIHYRSHDHHLFCWIEG